MVGAEEEGTMIEILPEPTPTMRHNPPTTLVTTILTMEASNSSQATDHKEEVNTVF